MCAVTGVCEIEVHEAMKRDEAWWPRQKLIGYQPLGGDTCLQMVNCVVPGCDSTLCREVPVTTEILELIEASMRKAREFTRMVDAARVRVAA